MKKLIIILISMSLAACGADRLTLVTPFWHSEICHPEIYYIGEPPNATPACKWTKVPPIPGVVDKR